MEPARIPLARVKRVMKEDPEVVAVSNAAVQHMASAIQLFVGYFTEQALMESRAEGRQRIAYRDFAQSVADNEQLAFLGRLIPKTVPFAEINAQRVAANFNDPPGIPVARVEEQLEADQEDESD